MNERKTLRHGQAKIQFYACRGKVQQLMEEGYSIRAIHDQLIEKSEITMSYKALHCNITKNKPKCETVARQRPTSQQPLTPRAAKPLGQPVNRPQAAMPPSPVMPTDKIISVADIMAKKQAELKEFTETQFVPDEDEDSHKA